MRRGAYNTQVNNRQCWFTMTRQVGSNPEGFYENSRKSTQIHHQGDLLLKDTLKKTYETVQGKMWRSNSLYWSREGASCETSDHKALKESGLNLKLELWLLIPNKPNSEPFVVYPNVKPDTLRKLSVPLGHLCKYLHG